MCLLFQLIEGMIAQFRVRLNGENGSSTGIIQTLNTMELWDVKFTSLLHGNNPLPEQEWLRSVDMAITWQSVSTVIYDRMCLFGNFYTSWMT